MTNTTTTNLTKCDGWSDECELLTPGFGMTVVQLESTTADLCPACYEEYRRERAESRDEQLHASSYGLGL